MHDIILHAFNWSFVEISRQAAKIAKLGYGAVLVPPPLYSDEKGSEWWQRYQPKDYRVIRSYLGRKADFIAAIEALHQVGLKVYVDVVFNHMANENRADAWHFPGQAVLAEYAKAEADFASDRLFGDLREGIFSPWDFNREGDIRNWMDYYESTKHSLSGLPDLDLNDWVVSQQINCLLALNDLGVDGYRVDAVKHLPVEHVRRVFEIPQLADKFIFGESLTMCDQEEGVFLWPVLSRTRISYYDFVLYETIRRAFSYGGSLRELINPVAFGQALDKWRAVTVSVTHDIPNNPGFRWQLLDSIDENLVLAYILGRDGGVPMVYSDHGESAQQYPEDRGRWDGLWQRKDLISLIQFHNAVFGLEQHSLYEADGYWVFARGNVGIMAINKTSQEQVIAIQSSVLAKGRWKNLLDGEGFECLAGIVPLVIPARSAQAWLYQA